MHCLLIAYGTGDEKEEMATNKTCLKISIFTGTAKKNNSESGPIKGKCS